MGSRGFAFRSCREYGNHGTTAVIRFAEARTDPAFAAEYQQRVVQPRRDQARAIFGRAIERGEIPAGLDVEVALDLIYDRRRENFDRHAAYVVVAYVAGG